MRGLSRLVLEILNFLSDNCFRHTDRASGPLTASKHVRDVVNFWMAAGPRNLHTTDQKARGSNPFGRTRGLTIILLIQDPFVDF